jgi:non-reducing end alpha-L-arabinofuranosidase
MYPVAVLLMLLTCIAGVALGGTPAGATTQEPCDIFSTAGDPCVAAYSTVRALFSSYDGPLYQVQRASDGQTSDIGLLATGGYADAASQDSFCADTVCTVTKIYDQSSEHNDLTPGPVGTAGSGDSGVRADSLPVTVDGHEAYGLLFTPGTGYRITQGAGVATNGQAESMYAVISGTYISQVDRCCFDFGNAETTAADTGNGHMDALNISDHCTAEPCGDVGPWFQADFENATFMGDGLGINGYQNPDNVGMGWNQPFLTGVLRNDGQANFALDGGSANASSLTSLYAGPLPSQPSGYVPMHQEGGIVLGIGGDNSNAASGAFFEGVMTQGYASNATIASVQSNIQSVGYSGTSGGGTGVPIAYPAAGKCIDVYGDDNGVDGAPVDIWDCLHDAVDQRWTPPNGLDSGPLRSLARCMDTVGEGTSPGTLVQLYDCNNAASQNWTQQSNGTLLNTNSGLCLTDPGGSTANGTQLDIETCTGATDQQFFVEYAYQPVGAPNGKCLDVAGPNNGGDGAVIDIWDCQRESPDQYWLHNANGSLTTIGRCLDDPSGSTTPGTKVQLYDCNGNVAQVWVTQANGSLLNPNSGLCLTDPGDSTTDGTQLDIEACTGNSDQVFSVASGQPINAPGGKCVDVSGDDQFGDWNDLPVQMWDCNPSAADQHWTHYPDNTLRNGLNRCLDIDGNSTASGTLVGQFNCNGVGGQQWVQQADGTLLNPQSGLCLTDPGGDTANGTQLDIETCAGASDQEFSYVSAVALYPGQEVSFRATTPCCTGDYIRHQNGVGIISPITISNPTGDKQDATWIVEPGLANSSCLSFESKNYPNGYLRQSGGEIYQQQNDNSTGFATDATFCEVPGMNGQGVSLQWYGNSSLYIRHYNGTLYIASDGGSDPWDSTTSWTDDVSFVPSPAWAP